MNAGNRTRAIKAVREAMRRCTLALVKIDAGFNFDCWDDC